MNIRTANIRLGEDLILRVPHGAAALTPTGALQLAEQLIRRGTTKMMIEEAHRFDQDDAADRLPQPARRSRGGR